MCKLLEWNDGTGMDEMSEAAMRWWAQVEARAIAASRGKMSTIRDMNRGHSNVVREGFRTLAGSTRT